jgi:hypothetical protein
MNDRDSGEHSSLAVDSVNPANQRRATRNYVVASIPVFDAGDPNVQGILCDLSETGLQVSGMPTPVGERRIIVIRADHLADVKPIQVGVVSRWAGPDDDLEEHLTGFEMLSPSPEVVAEVRKLIDLLSLD